jgi:MFS family permease
MTSLGSFALLSLVIALYGAACALLFPAISALVADRTSPNERGRATGIFQALFTTGSALVLCSAAAAAALVLAWADLGRESLARQSVGG